jgi:hypothetical protein
MEEVVPKFVQITASSGRLFALDEHGNVWHYQAKARPSQKQGWIRLSTERQF